MSLVMRNRISMENMDKYNYFNNSKNDKIPIFKYCNWKS